MPHFLIVSARYYRDLAAAQEQGAIATLTKASATYELVEVPGALEIAATIRFAIGSDKYDGFVALGCVIRGETTHYETVCTESAHALTLLALEHQAVIGNGIITVETEAQAWARAAPDQGDKGGFSANAALTLISLKQKFS